MVVPVWHGMATELTQNIDRRVIVISEDTRETKF